tara:strand:- start:48 stop:395 length:348 start_codon:yes stop_codon:yes gene_type:complete
VNDFYLSKGTIPRECKQAEDLRSSLREYARKRLLHVSDICLEHPSDNFRREFGLLHLRYANMVFVVTEAVQDVDYLIRSVITWIQHDFDNAMTGAQKEAAGLCGAELTKIVALHN